MDKLTINGKAITVKPMTAQDYGNYGLGMYPFLDELDAVLAKSNGQLSAKAQKIHDHKMLINAMRVSQVDKKDLDKYLKDVDTWLD